MFQVVRRKDLYYLSEWCHRHKLINLNDSRCLIKKSLVKLAINKTLSKITAIQLAAGLLRARVGHGIFFSAPPPPPWLFPTHGEVGTTRASLRIGGAWCTSDCCHVPPLFCLSFLPTPTPFFWSHYFLPPPPPIPTRPLGFFPFSFPPNPSFLPFLSRCCLTSSASGLSQLPRLGLSMGQLLQSGSVSMGKWRDPCCEMSGGVCWYGWPPLLYPWEMDCSQFKAQC